MVPFPRLHFFIPAHAPLVRNESVDFRAHNVTELTNDMFSSHGMMVDCDPRSGKYLTVAAMFRGQLSMRDVEQTISHMQVRILAEHEYTSVYIWGRLYEAWVEPG